MAMLSLQLTIIAIPLIVLVNLVRRLFSKGSLPASLPWVGTGPHSGPLSRARANLKSFFSLKSMLDEGYHKVLLTTTLSYPRLEPSSRASIYGPRH